MDQMGIPILAILGHGNGSVHGLLVKKELMMIHNSEHDREVKASQSNYVKFRFEVITTCCAAIFGTLFFGASWAEESVRQNKILSEIYERMKIDKVCS